MNRDELDRMHEVALELAVALLALAERAAAFADELERLADTYHAEEHERPLLVLRKGK